MSSDLFTPIHEIVGDITRWSHTLLAHVDDSWSEEQCKLLEIIQTSADNPSQWLIPIPSNPDELIVWKHDALSPLIAITGAAELMIEDFEAPSCQEWRDYAQKIFDASVQARELVVEIADAAQRRTLNG